jgi:hypothetical protein
MGRREPGPLRARDESTRPFSRYDRQVAPEDHLFEPGRPAGQNARYGEDTRLYRKLRVTAS